MEPIDTMLVFQCTEIVSAGPITEVVAAGCYVGNRDGTSTLRIYPSAMTARYMPVVGDYWMIYSDGWQVISPRQQFENGHMALPWQDVPGRG